MSHHLEAREIIESKIGKNPDDIDAVPILSTLYGPSSLVCHLVRPINENTFDVYFLIGQSICGPSTRPPMFDHLTLQDDQFTTRTSEKDAAEHLINNIGKGVIAGHNLAGLLAEAGVLRFNQGRPQPADLMVTGYDYVRYKDQVLPHQDLVIIQNPKARQPIQIDERSITFTPAMTYLGEIRAVSQNLRLQIIETLDDEARKTMMYQHWYPEITAQGLGVSKAHLLSQRLIPIFLECDKSWFAPILARAGDLVRSRLHLFDSEENQAFANSETFIGDEQVASQEGVLLEFFPIEVVFPGS